MEELINLFETEMIQGFCFIQEIFIFLLRFHRVWKPNALIDGYRLVFIC